MDDIHVRPVLSTELFQPGDLVGGFLGKQQTQAARKAKRTVNGAELIILNATHDHPLLHQAGVIESSVQQPGDAMRWGKHPIEHVSFAC
jgi:hypothetical protein